MTRHRGVMLLALLVLAGRETRAQSAIDRQIRDNQQRLEQLRRERDQHQQQLERLRGRVHDISGELTSIARQKSTTTRLVNELDRQILTLSTNLDTLTTDLLLTEDALAEKRAVLHRRVTDIYKRGPLWTVQVLLAAQSFAGLVSQYKYLYMVSRQDQALVAEIQELHERVSRERATVARVRTEVAGRRDERGRELRQFVDLERRQRQSLSSARASERVAVARLDSLSNDERQLNDLVESLERRRRETAAAASARGLAAPVAGEAIADSRGALDWPVEGQVLYRFGTAPGPGRTTIRNNGIGIKVPAGTPVRAAADGVVRWAAPLGTYGQTVWLEHSDGYYTLYLYLSRVSVDSGQRVSRGTEVGLSGGEATDHGPHVEFQIRQGALPLDPSNWLKPRKRD